MEPEKEIILSSIKKQIKNRKDLDSIKRKISKKNYSRIPPNSELLKAYRQLVKIKKIFPNPSLEEILRTRKVRSLSGIVVVSVLTKPYPCPGKCIYCPQQKEVPKSYLKEEPAVARAIMFKYHPYHQTKARIEALKNTGHPIDKVDIRIIGGTWSYYPKNYQTWFIKEIFKAANEYGKKRKNNYSLEKLQKRNEKAKCRIIGITIETRPDYITKKEIKRLRKLGITRVELGVQSIYDDILKKNKRGHTIKETITATRLLKDSGFKICYQMMPNLPGSSFKKDIKMFKELFSNPGFQPDYLKIYPCALLKEAPLSKIYKENKYKPYSEKILIKLLIEIKNSIPYYCRIQRIIRDIPSEYIIEGGTKTSNLRQLISQKDIKCKCIRCREIKEKYDSKEKIYLFREEYDSSEGKEIFLSFENKNRTKLYSLLRLRIPSKKLFLLVLENSSIVRELHTYGKLVPISQKKKAPQHKGLGKKLMKEAEKISKKEFNLKRISVISGIGVREYYRKLEYFLKDTYMIKDV